MSNIPGRAHERFCHICWYCGRCWRIALKGSFQSATNWAGVLGAAVLAFLLARHGHKLMPAEEWHEIIAQGLLYVVIAWLVIFLARLFFVAPFQIKAEGEQHGTVFVFREPKLAFHRFAAPKDNNLVFQWRFPDAPPFSLINYKIVVDGRSDLISVDVAAHPKQLVTMNRHTDLQYTKGSIRVNRRRDMCMKFFMLQSADPISVRVYVTGWDKEARILSIKDEVKSDSVLQNQIFS